jgi:hypothetical protein
MPLSRGNRTGRVHPHQRPTDNSVAILGQNLDDIGEDYENDLHDTVRRGMDDKCRKNYRQRLARIALFWKESCPQYYNVGVREVGTDECNDMKKFYFGRYRTDLVYAGMNVDYVLHFLMQNVTKADGKLKSFQDIRKYRDAILWGSKVAEQRMPQTFFEQTDIYLEAYKKKFVSEKKLGNVDEYATDPIPMPVYQLLLKWSIETNNVFSWFWTLSQWSFMARSASIDPLAFHHFALGVDSIIGKYDDSKADKIGERLSEKNIYANPFNWKMCWWTGMGVYCSVFAEALGKHERLFLRPNVKDGAAATKYCEQMLGIVGEHRDEIMGLMRHDHLNPYGLRKGAATHAVSGTTSSPSIPSIARRGEWSMGAVLDVYWHFSSTGDHYLGRILAGLDPNTPQFGTLPPHWTTPSPLGNPLIKRAMVMLYGPILDAYASKPLNNPIGLLLRCLACVVYHSDDLLDVMVQFPGHDFTNISILHDRALLDGLRALVTTDPILEVMAVPTGIPPHVGMAQQLATIMDMLTDLVEKFGEHGNNLMAKVEEALDTKAWESGHVTGSRLKEILENFQKDSIGAVDRRLEGIRVEFNRAMQRGDEPNVDLEVPRMATQNQGVGAPLSTFAYGGKFYGVPKNFSFPNVRLREAIRFWLFGQTVSSDGHERVRPFRKLTLVMLPRNLNAMFRTKWLPIFKYLQEVLAPQSTETFEDDEDEIEQKYQRALAHLKERVSYCWNKTDPTKFTLGTWSNKTSRSAIMKCGNLRDREKLSEASNRNNVRPYQKRKKKTMDKPLYPFRQRRRIEKQQRRASERDEDNGDETDEDNGDERDEDDGDEEEDAFGLAFPVRNREMTPYQAQRDKEIQEQVTGELDNQQRAARAHRQVAGDAVATDGSLMFVRQPPIDQLPPNYGDNSNISRKRYAQVLDSGSRKQPARKKPPRTTTAGRKKPPPTTTIESPPTCAIQGCTVGTNLKADHKCHNKCGRFFHNLCAQANDLCEEGNELNMYCCMECKTCNK